MGFLDKLRGTENLSVTVVLEPPEVQPGGEVTVRFDVGGELDDKCRGVRVGIEGTARYLVKERERDVNDNVDTDEVWHSDELHAEEHHYPAQIGPGQATFTLPADAPPASADAVEWRAFARVDREKGADKVERVDLAVRHSAAGLPQARAPQVADDGLTLDDVPVAVRAGDALTGHLTVNLADDAKVTAVRIRLHRRRTYTAEIQNDHDVFGGDLVSTFVFSGNTGRIVKDDQVAEVDLAGKREFARGAAERLPFTIEVPVEPGPTTAHPHATVEWRLEAVLDRRMRNDLSVDTPLIVY